MNVAPVDDGPEVSIGIVEVSVEEDASDFIVSLANLFNDIDDDNASILKTAQANTSPGLVTATVAGDGTHPRLPTGSVRKRNYHRAWNLQRKNSGRLL